LATMDADFIEHRADDPFAIADERGKQMDGVDLRMLALAGNLLRALHRFLRLGGELFESKRHDGLCEK
jgi:hypothetical protein